MGLTTTASGARSFRAFCATIERPETKQAKLFTMHIIPNDEDDESFQHKDLVEQPQPTEGSKDEPLTTNNDAAMTTPQATVIDMGPITHIIPEDPEPKSMDPQDELLRWHYCLGHLPFDLIKQRSNKGQLPKHLLSCHIPFCAACQYGKMTKRPWRVKGDNKETANRQSLSYCGMSAHFQNGIAERCIRDLQEQTRTSMLYAMNKWRKMVIINMWPYAMRHANDVANATPRKGQELSPLELFSMVQIAPKLCHFHAFGCPTYMLDNAMQSGQGAPKWKERSRLGVYLGPSPNHALSIALVMNPRTGHVYPQFHIKFNDFFETVQAKATDLDAPDPEWKYLSGFATKKGTPKSVTKGGLDGLLAP